MSEWRPFFRSFGVTVHDKACYSLYRNLETAVLALMKSPAEYDAVCIFD